MTSGWCKDEAQELAERWQLGGTVATLPGSCPHCDHNGAFTTIRVPAQVATGLGDSYLQGMGEELPDLTLGFPVHWSVTCACGHPDHSDEAGCGRTGWVKIPPGS